MTRQTISRGAAANDGTGDTLRDAALKINQNFEELFIKLGGDSDILMPGISFDSNGIIFEGTNLDSWETRLIVANPTADRTVTIPDATGNIVLDTATQTLTNKTVTSAVLTTPRINDTSADHQYIFAVSELAANRTITLPLLSGNDTFVFQAHNQTLTNKTLTSPTINTPSIGTSINDTNGAELIRLVATSSAVNDISITNAVAGTGPTIGAVGDDSNVNLNISSKGTGAVRVQTKLAYSSETLTSSGAISLLVPLTLFNSGSTLTMTLANGSVAGETKKLVNINLGLVNITPTTFSQGTSISLRSKGHVNMTWSGSSWYADIDDIYDSSQTSKYYFVRP